MNEQIKFDVTLNKYVQKYLNSWAYMDLILQGTKRDSPSLENFEGQMLLITLNSYLSTSRNGECIISQGKP